MNSSLLRRSGVRNADANAVSTAPPVRSRGDPLMTARCRGGGARGAPPCTRPSRGDDVPAGATRPSGCRADGRPLPGRASCPGSARRPSATVGGPPAAAILSLRGSRERVRADLQRDRDVAVAEHLDGLALADRARGDQRRRRRPSPPSGNSAASSARLTTWYSTRNGFLKPLSLGSRMCSGICPPSKRGRDLVAGLGALGAATGGLALGALTATDAGLGGLGARAPGAGGGP